MDENLKRKAQKLVNNGGNEFLTQLEATIELGDKLDSVVEAIQSIPVPEPMEMPEHPTEMSINNLPEVQKVEITNLPQEKDDTEVKNLLKELIAESKKKEQYAYDIEIDTALKEQLKGERGEDGLNGLDGKDGNDGSPDTPQEIVGKLSTLSGEERLDARHIKNLPEPRVTGGARAFSQLYDVNISSPTNGQVPVYNSTTQKWENGTVSGGSSLTIQEVDGTPSGTPSILKMPNGSLTDNGDGSFTFAASGSGTVTSVGSLDGSVTVTNPTSTPDLSVVKSPKLTTPRTISITGDVAYTSGGFDGSANVTGSATISNGVVTLAKQADVATGTVFYRKTAGTGSPEVQTLATLKTDLGLTGTNTGDQTITLTGDVTGSGTGSFATTLATVNSNVGSFGSASSVATFTVNAKGLITAAASTAISIVSSAITDFASSVRGTVLTGLSLASTTVISATDTVLVALGSLQAQITALTTTVGNKVSSVGATGPITSSGGTTPTISTSMATNKLIGRGTAGTGVMEEITIGTGLSLTGTTLNATGSGGTITTQDEGSTLSTTVTTLNFTGAGVTASGSGSTTTINIPGGSGSFSATETEIDFGSKPVYDYTFTIIDASINSSHKIIITESGNPATGQGSGDGLWDSINYSAVSGTGQFTLYANPIPGPVMGKRKIYYTYA